MAVSQALSTELKDPDPGGHRVSIDVLIILVLMSVIFVKHDQLQISPQYGDPREPAFDSKINKGFRTPLSQFLQNAPIFC